MFNKRTSPPAGRRLRVELLEGRDVPASVSGDPVQPVVIDPTVPVQVGDTSTDQPVIVINTGAINPGDIMTMSAMDAVPQGPPVDLALTSSVDKLKPSINGVVTITITITNNGSVQATGVTANAALPAGLSFVSASLGLNKFDPTTGDWKAGTIAAKGKAILTIKAKVTDSAAQTIATSITQADQTDDDTTNNTASATVTPVLGALSLSKTTSAPAVAVGSTVAFTLAVGNKGPGVARNVMVTDKFPSGLAFGRILSATQGAFNPGTGVWNIGAIAPGTIAVLRYTVTVNKFAQIDTSASLTGIGFDPDRSKVDATVSVAGVKANSAATWAYFAGTNFGHGATPLPVIAKGTSTTPLTAQNTGTSTLPPLIKQYLLAAGFKLPGVNL
ncbi:MAG TPA: DUF11 domain-containing protein [Gemmataceae bacterium]|jgi:uncharacterized repeat protein (TIGR01451 family)|nr:DUF11 domain-containing protein [Gemmataceae bacterium]